MKRFLCALVLTCMLVPRALADVAITTENFPSNSFRNYVWDFDTDGNGVLSDTEIAAVTYMNISDDHNTAYGSFHNESIKGIGFFTALENLVIAEDVTDIYLNSNTALKYLSFSDYGTFNQNLTSLDLSANTELVSLDCHDSYIASLNINALQA